jgi:lysophospholipase L1-like esterase
MPGTIVFIGDSITDYERRTDPVGLGGGYVALVAAALRERGDDATIINTGVSGDKIADLQERWQADALDHHPTILTVYIGVNDTLVTFFEGRPTPPELFERRYTDVLERTVAAGVPKLIIVDPFYLDTEYERAPWGQGGNEFFHADLNPKREIVRALADRFGAAFVPLGEVMAAAAKERGPVAIAADGVHPSAYGHHLIARQWLLAYDTVTTGG